MCTMEFVGYLKFVSVRDDSFIINNFIFYYCLTFCYVSFQQVVSL